MKSIARRDGDKVVHKQHTPVSYRGSRAINLLPSLRDETIPLFYATKRSIIGSGVIFEKDVLRRF